MAVKRRKTAAAVTLIEVMAAMAILAIAALGTGGYQYYAVQQTKVANAQVTATRTAQLLLEDWKSTGGSIDYDPAILGLGFSTALSRPDNFIYSSGMSVGANNVLRNTVYAATINNIPMLVLLLYRDVDYDSAAEITLRELTVVIREGKADAEYLGYLDGRSPKRYKLIRPITLTTYARLDAASG